MRSSSSSNSQYLCIPRLNKSSRTLSPTTLLARFREGVFRLLMWSSALSKTTHNAVSPAVKRTTNYYHQASDPHHSEAVADCIKFIKKTALTEQTHRESTTSTNSIDATTDLVIPVPVM